jgi:hypothetical protein
MESLTKENFWNEMEQKYPKAMKNFKEWIDKYKSEHDWGNLFNAGMYRDQYEWHPSTTAPKYHELPIAMQFGIFLEWYFNKSHDMATAAYMGSTLVPAAADPKVAIQSGLLTLEYFFKRGELL